MGVVKIKKREKVKPEQIWVKFGDEIIELDCKDYYLLKK